MDDADDLNDYCRRKAGQLVMRELRDLWLKSGATLPDFGVGLAINAATIMTMEGVPKEVWDDIWQMAEQTPIIPS